MTSRSNSQASAATQTRALRQIVLHVCMVGTVAMVACNKSSDKPNAAESTAAVAAPVTANQSVRAADTIPTGTDAQADSLLVDVQSIDKTIVVDMRYRNASNFTGAPLPGYQGNHAFMRREAALALAQVQASLKPQGLGLKIWDAYRPVRATLEMVAWTVRVHRENLVRDGYIADKSKHNLGVAIDLTLINRANGRELDMGTPHDEFSTNAHTANATGAVAANRAILVNAMAAQKFANYDQEWWHFSFDVPNPLRFDMIVR
ncbi:MAG: M15 family metallopeptidase [Gemmatimonadaceae bacterium]